MARGDKDREAAEERAAKTRKEAEEKGIMQALRDRQRAASEKMLREQAEKGY